MAKADGEVIIDSEINTDGAEAGAQDINKSLKRIISQLEKLSKTAQTICNKMGRSFSTAADDMDTTMQSAEDVTEAVKKTAKEVKKASKDTEKSPLTITRGEDVYTLNDDGSRDYIKKSAETSVDKSELKAVEEAEQAYRDYWIAKGNPYKNETTNNQSSTENVKKELTLLQEVKQAKADLKKLEAKGYGAGDKEYDNAQKSLINLTEALRSYAKTMVYETQQETYTLGTLEGKIARINKEIEQEKSIGTGIEDPYMQYLVGKLTELKGKYKEVYAEASKTPTQKEEAKRLKEIGDSATVSSQRIVQLNKELEALNVKMKNLKAAGVTSGFEEYDTTAARIREIKEELKEYSNNADDAGKKTSIFKTALNGVKASAGKVKTAISKMASALLGVHKNSKGMNVSLNGGLKTLLKYGLGIRSLYVLFNKLRSAITTGMTNLAAYDATTNSSINSVSNALTRLKNSLATAFAPILNVVAPILTKFINMLSTAISYIGAFFAALTGQSSYTKAIGVQNDYASSVENTADAAQDAADATNEAKKANDRYLSGLDEVKKWQSDDTSSSGSGSGGNGGSGGSSSGAAAPAFETVEIPNKVSDFVKKLKDLFAKGDYDAIGKIIAKKINQAFAKVKSLIAWENVGGVVKKYVKAFCGIFNGLVDGINWDLIGSTFSTGINTLLHTVNLLLTGINWQLLGSSIATGLNGAVRDLDWALLGRTIGSYFTASLQFISSAILTFNWAQLGTNLSTGINSLVNYMNITLTAIDWVTMGSNFISGINSLIYGINWTELGALVGNGINSILGMLWGTISTFDYSQAGKSLIQGINGIINTVNWTQIGQILSGAFIGALNFISAALAEFDWAGVGKAILNFLSGIDWAGVFKAVCKLIGTAFAAALKAAFVSLPATIGGIIKDAIVAAPQYFQQKVEEMGGDIVAGIFKGIKDGVLGIGNWIKENIFDPFIEGFCSVFGIASPSTVMAEQGGYIVSGLLQGITSGWSTITSFFTEATAGLTSLLGTAWEGIKGAATTAWSGISGKITGAWGKVKSKTTEVWDSVSGKVSSVWGDISSWASEKFGQVKDAVTGAMTGTQTETSTATSQMASDVSTNFGNSNRDAQLQVRDMKNKVSEELGNLSKSVKSYSGSYYDIMTKKWERIAERLQQIISGTVNTNVSNALDGIVTTCRSKGEAMGDALNNGLSSKMGSIRSTINNSISSVNGAISNINSALRSISSAFSFRYNIPSPKGGRVKGSVSLNLPTVGTVPYLATGAVIPPNAPFTAVLGDQKSGTNLEAPESLIRKIIREEMGGKSNSGNTYKVEATVGRRALFEVILEEAKLRQQATGRNPLAFE